jgi:ABC-type bacteriocin/lantibiotic exporter with double-glycine peptidase domain
VTLKPFQQEQPHTCAVACLRTVAHYFGIERDEATLESLCDTRLDGTMPEDLAHAARQLGFSVMLSYDQPDVLAQSLQRDLPVIVFLGILTANSIENHAVTITALNEQEVIYLDPTDALEHRLSRATFFTCWEYLYHVAIVITPSL